MADKKLPFFRWYPKDAETDEFYNSLTDGELGFYHRCLNWAWLNNGLPIDPVERAKALRKPRGYCDRMWAKISSRFELVIGEGRISNPRLEVERDYAVKKSQMTSANSVHSASKAPGFVYFIQRRSDGAVKIGSSNKPSLRLAQLKYKYRDSTLSLIESVRVRSMGDCEIALHEKFAELRLTGEWFRLSDSDLRAGITLAGDTWGESPYHPAPRAYGSGSASVAGVEEKTTTPEVYPTPLDVLTEADPVYERLGAPTPNRARQPILQLLMGLTPKERQRVINYVKWAAFSGKWRGPATTKSLMNLLSDPKHDWDIEITAEMLERCRAPDRKLTKTERAQAVAAEDFAKWWETEHAGKDQSGG